MSIWDEPQLLNKPQADFSVDGSYFGHDGQERYKKDLAAYEAQQAGILAAAPKLKSKEDFMATVKPEMLDAQGKFKGPQAGVNFALEGMTPEEAYATAQGMNDIGPWSDDNRLGKPYNVEQANVLLDAGWRAGPDNGGGFLGGVGRAVQGTWDGIRTNPALMAGLSAVAAPLVSKGLSATGMSAGAVKTATPMVMNAGKALASGGNLKDVAKSAGLSYLGGMAGDAAGSAVGDATGNATAAKIAATLAKGAISGGGNAAGSITSAAVGLITDNIDGFSGLSQAQKSIINNVIANAIRGKKITPALIAQVMSSASSDVKPQKETATRSTVKTGGWA